jgi:hypothetical protein
MSNVVRLPTKRIPGYSGLDVVNRAYVDQVLQLQGLLVFIGPNPGPPNPMPGQLWWRNDPDGALYLLYDDGTTVQWIGV